MAETVRLGLSVDIGSLRQDLDAVSVGLGRELGGVLADTAGRVAHRTAELFPVGPGPRSPKDNLPHIAETISGAAAPTFAVIASDHPAANVVNYGGTIAPKGVPITFPHALYAQRAYDELAPAIETELQDAVDGLASRHLNA